MVLVSMRDCPPPRQVRRLVSLPAIVSFCCLQSPAWWKSGFVIIAPYLLLARWALKTLDFLTSHFSHFFSTLTNITLVIRPIPPLLSLAHSINHHHIHHCFHPTICFSICIVFCIQVEGSSLPSDSVTTLLYSSNTILMYWINHYHSSPLSKSLEIPSIWTVAWIIQRLKCRT